MLGGHGRVMPCMPWSRQGILCTSPALSLRSLSADVCKELAQCDYPMFMFLRPQMDGPGGQDTGALLRFVQQAPHWIDMEEGELVRAGQT